MRGPILLAALACVALAMPPARATEAGDFKEISRLPSRMSPATRTLQADASARRLFEIGQPSKGRGMRIDAYDLDTLAPAGSLSVPQSQSGFGGRLVAVDEMRHRMFVVYPVKVADDAALRTALGSSNEDVADQTTRTIFAIAIVDTLRLQIVGARSLPEIGGPPSDRTVSNQIGIKAISYYAPEDKLYLVTQATVGASELAASNHLVAVHQLDAGRLLGSGVSAVDWSYPVPQCAMVMAKEEPGVVFRSQRRASVYIPCRSGGFGAGTQQPLETPGVVRLNMAGTATTADVARFSVEFFPLSGNLQSGFVSVDPLTERLFLRVDASATESGVWIFDTNAASWLGLVVTPGGGAWGVAVDPSAGRLYVLSPPRLQPYLNVLAVIASTRGIEPDQGRVVQFRPGDTPIPSRPLVDPIRRRLFWSTASDYLVLRDDVPRSAPAGVADPDANTSDIAEGEQTAVNFLGGTQAFGARIRWVGGTRGVQRNANTLIENPPLPGVPFQTLFPPVPTEGTRDIHLARVLRSTLSGGEASASATGADRDRENTDGDLVNYTVYMRDRGGPNLVARRWPYRIVTCTDFGSPGDARQDAATGATVGCERNESAVDATAKAAAPVEVPSVTVASASATTRVIRDPRRGVVSIAEAEATGVDIAGAAGIGRITSRAESWAAGRPGTAGTSFQRTISDVWVRTQDGTRQTVCAGPCSPSAARDALNAALGARFRVDLPQPDPVRAAGTPGGYEALAVRDPYEVANEAALNDEAGVRLEVPAMVLTGFADGRNRSRMVVSLAASSAESHYGIYRLARTLPSQGARPSVLGVQLPTNPIGPSLAAPSASGTQTLTPVGSLFGNGLATVVRRSFSGIVFLFTSPGQAVRAFGLWLFLAAPLLLLMRRRPGG